MKSMLLIHMDIATHIRKIDIFVIKMEDGRKLKDQKNNTAIDSLATTYASLKTIPIVPRMPGRAGISFAGIYTMNKKFKKSIDYSEKND